MSVVNMFKNALVKMWLICVANVDIIIKNTKI